MRWWSLSVGATNTTGISKASATSFALGKQIWTVKGDKYECNEGKTYTKELKLTGCMEGEFTCSDGQCVSMDVRCNQLVDCRDKTDEKDCHILFLEESYNKKVSPISRISATNQKIKPTQVEITITLIKIVSLEKVSHIIELQFSIMLKWKENRVNYHNLKIYRFVLFCDSDS